MTDQEQKKQRIIRSKPDTEYFSLPNAAAQNIDIPYDALGVLTYLLSKPVDWETTVFDLRRRGDGKGKIYRILQNLEQAGYMSKPTKYQDAKTKRWVWTPRKVADTPRFSNPCPTKPDTAHPDTANEEIKEQRTEEKEQITKKDSAVTKSSDGAVAADVDGDTTWTKATWDDKSAFSPYCHECGGRYKHGDTFYHKFGRGSRHICPGCWVDLHNLSGADLIDHDSKLTHDEIQHMADLAAEYAEDQPPLSFEHGNINSNHQVPTYIIIDKVKYVAGRTKQGDIMQLMRRCNCEVGFGDETDFVAHTLYAVEAKSTENIMVCLMCNTIVYGREHSKRNDPPELTDEQVNALQIMSDGWVFGDKPIPRDIRGKLQDMGYCHDGNGLTPTGRAALQAWQLLQKEQRVDEQIDYPAAHTAIEAWQERCDSQQATPDESSVTEQSTDKPPPKAKKKRKRSVKQLTLDAMIEAIIAATPYLDRSKIKGGGWAAYRTTGKWLLAREATPQDMPDFVAFVLAESKSQNWVYSARCLTGKDRWARFCGQRKAQAVANVELSAEDMPDPNAGVVTTMEQVEYDD